MLLSWNNLYIRISYESHTSSIPVLAGRTESNKKERNEKNGKNDGYKNRKRPSSPQDFGVGPDDGTNGIEENEKGHCHYKVGRRCRVRRNDERRMSGCRSIEYMAGIAIFNQASSTRRRENNSENHLGFVKHDQSTLAVAHIYKLRA